MDYLLAYGAGLLTLINPCVLPVVPLVLASALATGRTGPLALMGGMSLSFVALGLAVSVLGRSLGLESEHLAMAGAVLMLLFGAVLLVPALGARFAEATAGLSSGADAALDRADLSGMRGQFLAGLLLGAVWSPCVGPTLGAALALAWSGENLSHAALVMVLFAAGVSSVMLALAYGSRHMLVRRQGLLRRIAPHTRVVTGVVLVGVGVLIVSGAGKAIESWLLDVLPHWLQDLSVAL